MNALEKYKFWLKDSYFDEKTKEELLAIAEDKNEIEERFYRDLEFGTGGLRGIIGAGTNRMNIYTVRKATQGLANYILNEKTQEKGVAIAFDSRNMSHEFAQEAALCLAANGIRAYIFPSLRPTPELSFALRKLGCTAGIVVTASHNPPEYNGYKVYWEDGAHIFPSLRPTPELSFALRKLGCTAGIVVTASHNPPEYNGYKVYWEDGAQITAPRDRQIIEEVQAVTDFDMVKTMSCENAVRAGLYEVISPEMDDCYMEELKKLVVSPEVIRRQAKNLKIVYTPLHGTGNIPVRRILRELGFEQVYVVKEQELPDGDFPTVSYPNPEDKKAFALALKLAEEVDADVVLATDPDADRLGIYAKDTRDGAYKSFTGNMSGMIILEYLLSQKKELGLLPDNGAIVTTIVSGKMSAEIAKRYKMKRIETLTGFKYIGEQIKFFEQNHSYDFQFGYEESYGWSAEIAKRYKMKRIETLTGFKYIGEQIKFFEQNHSYDFQFGYEESYGCLVGTHARDKDAIVAVMALCEAAAYYKEKGITLCEQMENLYETYGFFKENLCTVTLKGQDGAKKIASIMEGIRKEVPQIIGGKRVTQFRDYQKEILMDYVKEEQKTTGLPKSNVLYFELEDGTWCCIRPSGTEPKIKFYIGIQRENELQAQKQIEEMTEAVKKCFVGEEI